MRSKVVKIVFVIAIALVAGINVFNAQKSDVLSDVALANVEALASDSENTGLPWRGYIMNYQKSCCEYEGLYSLECSGNYERCK